MTVTIQYSEDCKQEFKSVEDAVKWMMGIGSDMLPDATLTDGKSNSVKGFHKIIYKWEYNNDMWNGDDDCIHLKTSSGSGGGQHCDSCPAWFCY